MTVPKEKYSLIFKMLLEKPLYEVGVEFGFDKHYKDSVAVKNAVYRVLQKVKARPEEYGVSQDTLDAVLKIVKNRRVTTVEPVTLREKKDALEAVGLKELVLEANNKAMKLVHLKLDDLSSSKKKLENINLVQLTTAFGTIFDKAQLIKGEATENVAVLAKIDKSMTPEDALKAVLQMREFNNADKEKKK